MNSRQINDISILPEYSDKHIMPNKMKLLKEKTQRAIVNVLRLKKLEARILKDKNKAALLDA